MVTITTKRRVIVNTSCTIAMHNATIKLLYPHITRIKYSILKITNSNSVFLSVMDEHFWLNLAIGSTTKKMLVHVLFLLFQKHKNIWTQCLEHAVTSLSGTILTHEWRYKGLLREFDDICIWRYLILSFFTSIRYPYYLCSFVTMMLIAQYCNLLMKDTYY